MKAPRRVESTGAALALSRASSGAAEPMASAMNIVGEAKKKEIATNRRMDRTNVGGAADAPPPGIEIPELQPTRFDVEDAEGIRAHLKDYGFVAIKDVAGEAELEHARGLLWSHLGEHGWIEGQRLV